MFETIGGRLAAALRAGERFDPLDVIRTAEPGLAAYLGQLPEDLLHLRVPAGHDADRNALHGVPSTSALAALGVVRVRIARVDGDARRVLLLQLGGRLDGAWVAIDPSSGQAFFPKGERTATGWRPLQQPDLELSDELAVGSRPKVADVVWAAVQTGRVVTRAELLAGEPHFADLLRTAERDELAVATGLTRALIGTDVPERPALEALAAIGGHAVQHQGDQLDGNCPREGVRFAISGEGAAVPLLPNGALDPLPSRSVAQFRPAVLEPDEKAAEILESLGWPATPLDRAFAIWASSARQIDPWQAVRRLLALFGADVRAYGREDRFELSNQHAVISVLSGSGAPRLMLTPADAGPAYTASLPRELEAPITAVVLALVTGG